jgi:hypothetical protein
LSHNSTLWAASDASDAQAWLDQIVAAHVTGTWVQPKAGLFSVGEVHAKWLGTQGPLKATSVSTRFDTWSAHVEPCWAQVALVDVQTSAIRAWVQDMVNAGAGPETVGNALTVLRQIVALAVEDKRLAQSRALVSRHRAANIVRAAG